MDQTGSDNIGKGAQRGLALGGGLGVALAAAAGWIMTGTGGRSLLFWLCVAVVLGGLFWAALAAFLPAGRLLRAQRWVTGNVLVFALMLGVVEGCCRLAGVNFNNLTGQTDDPRAHYPLCLRMPDRPVGEIFFTRAGPLTWTGRPLATFLKINHGTDAAYEEEAEITTRYDADGFRNPEGLKDWQAVVVGDSFTECGALPEEQMFTTVAARRSGVVVRNLGVCNTGTLAHGEYLRRFGKGPSTRQAVLAFYDGNDILDTAEEQADLDRHRRTGWRPLREPQPQTSLVKAGYQVARHLLMRPQAVRYQNAWLTTGEKETPLMMRAPPMPLDPETATREQMAVMEGAIRQFADACRELKLEPALLYIPANNRTYHGLVRYRPEVDATTRAWVPGTLPEHLREFCAGQGMAFIDACPVLRGAAEKGTPVYNLILDTHLNAEGARLIGELLAKHFENAKTGTLEMTTRP